MKNINRIIDSELIASRAITTGTTIPTGSGSSTSGGGLQNNDGTFTWTKYAPTGTPTSAEMVDIATTETLWIGLAYNKTGRIESRNPADYQWRLLTDTANMYWVDESGVKHFTWIKHAESLIAPYKLNDTAVGLKYMGIGLGKETAEPLPEALTEQEWFDALEWHQVLQGNPVVGENTYNWFKFAADIQGNDLSDYIGTRTFLGIAYGKDTPESSMNPEDYTFALITGLHVNPADGTSTWIKFSKTPNQGIQDNPIGTVYLGYSFGNVSSVEGGSYLDYTWKLVPQSTDNGGITMTSSLQTWLKFAPNGSPTSGEMSDISTGMTHIGLAINKVLPESEDLDSNDPSFYIWSLINGEHGYIGADGRTYYIWVRYADDALGFINFSADPGTRNFIGLSYANITPESESSAEASDPGNYLWSQIASDITRNEWVYMWIKFALSADGKIGFNDSPIAMTFMGIAYDKKTPTESDNPALYVWNPLQSEQGYTGADGKTYFTWVKYAYFIGAEELFNDAGDRLYMGYSFSHLENEADNVATGDGSSELSVTYSWYPIHTRALKDGLDGLDGNDGLDGQHGLDGAYGINGQHGSNGVDGTNGYNGNDAASVYQNNVIRVIKIKKEDLAKVTEEEIAAYIEKNGLDVTQYENVVFEIGDEGAVLLIDYELDLPFYKESHAETTAKFYWDNGGDDSLITYKVFFSSALDGSNVATELNTIELTGLLELTKYEVFLRGYDAYGGWKQSKTIEFTTKVSYTGALPEIHKTGVTSESISLAWSITPTFLPFLYKVYRNYIPIYDENETITGYTDNVLIYEGTDLEMVLEDLESFTDHKFYVVAYTEQLVASATSAIITVKTNKIIKTLTPPNLFAVSSDATSVTFRLEVPNDEGVVSFSIKYRIKGTDTWVTPIIRTGLTQTITGLYELTTYEIVSSSSDGSVSSVYSAILTMSTIKIYKAATVLSSTDITTAVYSGSQKRRYTSETWTTPLFSGQILKGTQVRLWVNFSAKGSISYNVTYDQTFMAGADYASMRDFYTAEITSLGAWGDSWTSSYGFNVDGTSFQVTSHRDGTASRDVVSNVSFTVSSGGVLSVIGGKPGSTATVKADINVKSGLIVIGGSIKFKVANVLLGMRSSGFLFGGFTDGTVSFPITLDSKGEYKDYFSFSPDVYPSTFTVKTELTASSDVIDPNNKSLKIYTKL